MTAIVERVCAVAAAEHARRVCAINLTCGALSGVVPDSLRFCFDVCSRGTIAEGATLNITLVPAKWICESCSKPVESSDAPTIVTCPSCSATSLRLVAGREFFLDSIEIE